MTRSHDEARQDLHAGVLHVPRSRGAVSGVLLIILGAWAATIPFIGPLFSYAYTPKSAWDWTAARGWLEVLPGVVALIAGVILLTTANRVTATFASWLGIASGAWLVIGRDVAIWLHIGSPGTPASSSAFHAALESLGLFSGIGAAIVLIGALALGRLTIHSVRDVRVAQKHQRKAEQQRRKMTDSAYAAGRRDEAAARQRGDHDHPLEHDSTARGGTVLGRLTQRDHGLRSTTDETVGATTAEDPQDR